MALDLWQRADIADIVRVPQIVAAGARSDVDIARQFGHTDRQGRYLIKAAEILGLITRPGRGRIVVTGLGKTLMAVPPGPKRREMLSQIVADSPPGREMLRALGTGSMTAEDAIDHFDSLGTTGLSRHTLEWRVPALLRTMADLGIVARSSSGTYARTAVGTRLARTAPKSTRPGAPRGTRRSSRRTVVDVERRKAIETAAVDHVSAHYESQGYDVNTREKENLGYDLEVVDKLLASPILVEVKGTSVAGRAFVVELSPNEYECLQANRSAYRVCVVSDALGGPRLHEFVYDAANKRWIDSDTSDVLILEERTAARLSI